MTNPILCRLQRIVWVGLATVPLMAAGCGDDLVENPTDAGGYAEPPNSTVGYTEQREVCLDRNPERNLYWGDLHVHTGYSFDAYVNELRLEPEDAYRFARGGSVLLPPLDENGVGTQPLSIERPLDFTAVTDHAEFFAEVQACITPESPAYDTPNCRNYRESDNGSIVQFGLALAGNPGRRLGDICTEIDCSEEAEGVWARTQQIAEQFYDRSENCEFTTFVAYEWTGSTGASNLHRNIIFRNAEVPRRPITYFEEDSARELWAALDRECIDTEGGCDVLAIPHNSNWSDGKMFFPRYTGADTIEEEREQATLRARMEPLVEIFQHKGQSECMNGLSGVFGEADELCDFELLGSLDELDDCGDGTGAGSQSGIGCLSRYDYVRIALLAGLTEGMRLGVNPYPLGMIGSTDTHNAVPGAVDERDYLGHTGTQEALPADRLDDGGVPPGGVVNGPGGLVAVWSVENSRDAIFDALRRREVYASSGPRIALRFFGSWDFPEDLCNNQDLVAIGYDRGVPMGGILPENPDGNSSPTFVVSALRDPGTTDRPGAPLQRIQVIKGWVDVDGTPRYQVFDVGGDPDNGASVNTDTCELEGSGFDSLCAVWTDPDYDPNQPAYYYARAVENPTCRWSTWLCNELDSSERPPQCDDPTRGEVAIQERAVSSPIWNEFSAIIEADPSPIPAETIDQ
ncbi:MAG: DUF3604 domain-containing protein [Myxococcales bacterium]|nr:DUF3604 domain-containing protein [Myxococcales bacterium]